MSIVNFLKFLPPDPELDLDSDLDPNPIQQNAWIRIQIQ
jgi:hypothetical protein